MSELAQLTDALKLSLKARGMTYGALAEALGLSEASVKRLFSDRSFTLERLEQILGVLGMSFLDLARLGLNAPADDITQLSVEQEDALAADQKLFGVFYLLLGGTAPKDILARYRITPAECQKLLLKLDKLRLIELHPGDVVKRLTGRHVRWRRGGALTRLYGTKMMQEFLGSKFDADGELIEFVVGRLTPASRRVLLRKIARLVRDFSETSEASEDLPRAAAERVALLVAMRPWSFSVIDSLHQRSR